MAAELSERARNRWLFYGSYVCIRMTLEPRPMKVALGCCFVCKRGFACRACKIPQTPEYMLLAGPCRAVLAACCLGYVLFSLHCCSLLHVDLSQTH